MNRLNIVTLCSVFTLLLFACGKEQDITVSSVSLDQTTIELFIGETVQLTATVQPKEATDKTVSWASSNQFVATVSATGLVTALTEGNTIITASSGDKSETCVVSVKSRIIDIKGITLSESSISLTEGEKTTIIATVDPSDATNPSVLWTSSDSRVATVSDGIITAISTGTAIITVTAGDKSAICNVTVSKAIIHVESININPSKKRMKIGEQFAAEVTVTPSDANDYTIQYHSDNSNIATVSEDGIITGHSSGNANIIIEADGKECVLPVIIFEKDLVYIASVSSKGNTIVGTIWKDHQQVFNAPNCNIQAFYFDDNSPLCVVNYYNQTEPRSVALIKDGVFSKLSISGDSFYPNAISSTQIGDDIYLLIEDGYDNGSGLDTSVWKNKEKLYVFDERAKQSKYSYCFFNKLFSQDNELYVYGCIQEPVSPTAKAEFPTVWKDGAIYKQFDVRETDANWGGSVEDMAYVNGKFYYLMIRSNGYSPTKIGLYDDNGKLYDMCYDATGSRGHLLVADGKLYAAIISSYSGAEERRITIFEDGKVIHTITIPDVYSAEFDIIEGDIYALVTHERRWGGEYYWSLSLYRNEIEEYTYIEEGDAGISCSGNKIMVFKDR